MRSSNSSNNINGSPNPNDDAQKTTDKLLDAIRLSPLDKYVKYGQFPWRSIIDVLLVICTSVSVLYIISGTAKHARFQGKVWKNILLNSTEETNTKEWYTVGDYQDHMKMVFETFSGLDSKIYLKNDNTNTSFELFLFYADVAESFQHPQKYPFRLAFNITEEGPSVFPFSHKNATSTKNFIQRVMQMSIRARNIISYMEKGYCANWTIQLDYNFESLSKIIGEITSTSSECSTMIGLGPKQIKPQSLNYKFYQNTFFLHFIIIFLAFLAIVLCLSYIIDIGINYMTARYLHKKNRIGELVRDQTAPGLGGPGASSALSEEENTLEQILRDNKPWEKLPLSDKMKFIDLWLVVSLVANFFQMAGAILSLLDMFAGGSNVSTFKEIFIGLGCFMAWINIAKYMEYSGNNYLLSNTLKFAVPNMVKFILGLIPIIMGYIYLGRCLFWKYKKFATNNDSFLTLFSIMTGDIIQETFNDVSDEELLGQLYLYSFGIIFIAAVHNVFVSIICEAFEEQRKLKGYEGFSILEDRKQKALERIEEEMSSAGKEEEKSAPSKQDIAAKKRESKILLTNIVNAVRENDFNIRMEKSVNAEKARISEKLKEYTHKVDALLDDMLTIVNDVDVVSISRDEKKYVINCYQKFLDYLVRKIKFLMNPSSDQ